MSSLPGRLETGAAVTVGGARAELAYQTLRLELLEGTLEAGDAISVVEVAARLACSRVPVMEALKRLEREGFVAIVPQVGCHVVVPRAADVADFFRLFAAAESTVCALAAERRNDDDLAAFASVCERIDRILDEAGGVADRDPTYRRVNLLFHGELHRMARSPVSTGIAASLWDRSDFYIKHAFGSLYFSRAVRGAHGRIRRAVVAGSGPDTQAAVVAHLSAVGKRVAARLEAGKDGAAAKS